MSIEWPEYTLGDLCKFKYGQMPKKSDLCDAGYPVFSGYHIVGFAKTFHYEEPEIIVVARGVGGTGDVKMSPPKCFLTNLSIVARVVSSEVDKRFLYYRLAGPKLWELRTGSAQAQITIDRLQRYELRLPPLPEQRKIAAILSAYDDLIENNLRRIKILEGMAQSLYREWFVRFRFLGHEKVRMVDSPPYKIPEGWVIARLAGVCKLLMGQSPKSEFYNDQGEGLPFHQGVTHFGERFPTNRIYCTEMNRIAEAGDILFSVRAPVGRINIAETRLIIGRGLAAIKSRSGDQWFTFRQLKERFKDEDTMGGGTIFKAVTKQDMEGIEFLKPAADVISTFEHRCDPLEKEIGNLTQKDRVLRHTLDLLLPKLICGELDVSELDIKVPEEAA
jgi:type I restriction enzyme S subunit